MNEGGVFALNEAPPSHVRPVGNLCSSFLFYNPGEWQGPPLPVGVLKNSHAIAAFGLSGALRERRDSRTSGFENGEARDGLEPQKIRVPFFRVSQEV